MAGQIEQFRKNIYTLQCYVAMLLTMTDSADTKTPPIIKIRRAQFELYEQVRKSGKTNMVDIEQIRFFCGHKLQRKHIIHIMKNYDAIKAKFSIPLA